MNPFLLWIPGVALTVIGVVLLASGIVGMTGGIALIVAATTIESIGVLLWARERKSRGDRTR
jgi:hypothetical protein